MNRPLVTLTAVLALVAFAGSGALASTREEAKAIVDKAAAFYQQNGREKALQEINNPRGQFVNGELYVFLRDLQGTNIAHPMNPSHLGLDVLEILDVDGKYFRKEGMEMVKKNGSGWVDYKFRNPKTNKVEGKTTYLKKADIVIGCGAYKQGRLTGLETRCRG